MLYSASSVLSADCIELFHLGCKEYNQSDFGVDHLVISMCRVSYVIRRGCLLWPVHSLGKTLLAFALLHFVPQSQISCYSRYLLTSYFCIRVPYDEKDTFFWVLVLEGLVGLHRTIEVQLLQHYWLGHRLGLLWYWMVCLERNRDHSVVLGEGNGNPLQYSCLENPMDRGAWWAILHGVAKSGTGLSDFTCSVKL